MQFPGLSFTHSLYEQIFHILDAVILLVFEIREHMMEDAAVREESTHQVDIFFWGFKGAVTAKVVIQPNGRGSALFKFLHLLFHPLLRRYGR
jgi:hypothetical protein